MVIVVIFNVIQVDEVGFMGPEEIIKGQAVFYVLQYTA